MDNFHKIKKLTDLDLRNPIALISNNFTSLIRTPWAGSQLSAGIKRAQSESDQQQIGESWEVSCDPDSPSRLRDAPSFQLSDVIEAFPEQCLSKTMIQYGRTSCDILVKLINASSPLSLQIHPSDQNPNLKPNECGKPESWLILSAEKNSGIYLGFSKKLSIDEIKSKLKSHTFSADLLQFVPVAPGDFFEIEPHVPHAIGPGTIILEPQRILAGKSGKTWRLWDWNRTYNSQGQLDATHGTPRELHIEQSLALLQPELQFGEPYVKSLRRSPQITETVHGATIKLYPPNSYYQVAMIFLKSGGLLQVHPDVSFGCLTILDGTLLATSASGQTHVMNQGESFFVPKESLPLKFTAVHANAQISIIFPAGPGMESQVPGTKFD